jgi:hypothetical protein
MALASTDALRNAFRVFMDSSFGSFTGFPTTELDAATKWAAAVASYASGIAPVTTTGAAAQAALQAGLSGMSAPGAGIAIMNAAFASWGTIIAGGMAPTMVGTPPPLLLAVTAPTLLTLFANGVAGASAFSQCTTLSALINTWVRTGTATPSGGGSPVPWS